MNSFAKRIAAVAAVGVVSASASATVLTFDFGGFNNDTIPANYGDRVGAFPNPPGWSYGADGGLTPNVSVQYDPVVHLGGATPADPTRVFGDLTNVMYRDRSASTGFEPGILTIRLSADPGYQVCLYGFSIAAVYNSFTTFGEDLPAHSIQVLTGGGGTLFRLDFDATNPNHDSLSTTWAPGTGPGQGMLLRHKRFLWDPIALVADSIVIRLDLTQLLTIGGSKVDRIGIDDIKFSQKSVPSAGAVTLLGVAGGLTGARRRRARA